MSSHAAENQYVEPYELDVLALEEAECPLERPDQVGAERGIGEHRGEEEADDERHGQDTVPAL